MAWQRKIPFGYIIQDGRFVCSETEAAAVQLIYDMYRNSSTYSQIADEMERRGICYHAHTSQWNKHMVKRILENQRYLGQGGYPRLLSEEDYHAVSCQRSQKTGYAPCSDSISSIRKRAVCSLCGTRITRDTKNRYPRWICQNSECGCHISIKDEILEKQVGKLLLELAHTPSLLTRTAETENFILPADALRIQNELTHALNRGDTDMVYMKTLVFAIAAEQYSALPDPTPRFKMEQLQQRLAQHTPDAADLRELFETAVQEVRIGEKQIELRLADGTLFRKS